MAIFPHLAPIAVGQARRGPDHFVGRAVIRLHLGASLRYLYHLGWVTDRREGVWMNYRLSVAPGSPEDKQLQLLADILSSRPEAQALRDRLEQWLAGKGQSKEGAAACQCS